MAHVSSQNSGWTTCPQSLIALAIQLVALWRSLKNDSESEWQGSLDPWTVSTLSLLGGLSAAYLSQQPWFAPLVSLVTKVCSFFLTLVTLSLGIN
jgi:hypothetical protein